MASYSTADLCLSPLSQAIAYSVVHIAKFFKGALNEYILQITDSNVGLVSSTFKLIFLPVKPYIQQSSPKTCFHMCE